MEQLILYIIFFVLLIAFIAAGMFVLVLLLERLKDKQTRTNKYH